MAPSNLRVRLSLVPLESRENPSTVVSPTLLDEPAAQQKAAVVANRAPSISDFRATVGPNGEVTFTGRVSDDQSVAGLTVRISGQQVDVTAIVQKDGTFRVTTTVFAPGDVTVTAKVTDWSGLTSDPAYTTFTPSN
jgi:hypothetical protein